MSAAGFPTHADFVDEEAEKRMADVLGALTIAENNMRDKDRWMLQPNGSRHCRLPFRVQHLDVGERVQYMESFARDRGLPYTFGTIMFDDSGDIYAILSALPATK